MQPINGLEMVVDGAVHSLHHFVFAGRARDDALLEVHVHCVQESFELPCVPHLLTRIKDDVPVHTKLCDDAEAARLSHLCARARAAEAAAALAHQYFLLWVAAEYPEDDW